MYNHKAYVVRIIININGLYRKPKNVRDPNNNASFSLDHGTKQLVEQLPNSFKYIRLVLIMI